jgi:hypothetical protein
MTIRIKKGSSKKTIQKQLSKAKSKGFPASKFTGKIKIKMDALAIQKKLRDEWE